MKANLQGRFGDLCRMPRQLGRYLGVKLPKKKKNLILQEQKSSLEECHTSKENRIKVVFKTNVKKAGDLTRGPINMRMRPQFPSIHMKSEAWRPGCMIPTLRKGTEENPAG